MVHTPGFLRWEKGQICPIQNYGGPLIPPISPPISRFSFGVHFTLDFGVEFGVVFGRTVIWVKKGQSECCESFCGLTGIWGFIYI